MHGFVDPSPAHASGRGFAEREGEKRGDGRWEMRPERGRGLGLCESSNEIGDGGF